MKYFEAKLAISLSHLLNINNIIRTGKSWFLKLKYTIYSSLSPSHIHFSNNNYLIGLTKLMSIFHFFRISISKDINEGLNYISQHRGRNCGSQPYIPQRNLHCIWIHSMICPDHLDSP